MIKKRKAETMAAKRHGARGEISLFIEKEGESDTRDDMDSDHANDKYLIQF